MYHGRGCIPITRLFHVIISWHETNIRQRKNPNLIKKLEMILITLSSPSTFHFKSERDKGLAELNWFHDRVLFFIFQIK